MTIRQPYQHAPGLEPPADAVEVSVRVVAEGPDGEPLGRWLSRSEVDLCFPTLFGEGA